MESKLIQIVEYIQSKDWRSLLNLVDGLDVNERKKVFNFLLTVNVDGGLNEIKLTKTTREQHYKNRAELVSMLNYGTLICSRTPQEIKQESSQYALESFFRRPVIEIEALTTFYQRHPSTYLAGFLDRLDKNPWSSPNFKLIWKLYEQGTIEFNERLFINSLLIVHMFDRNTVDDAQFLIDNPEALEKVFLKFYKHETPILDISKWQGRTEFECAKVTKYWSEVIDILQEEGVEIPRSLVENLLSTLNYNWKKPHINWHIQIVKKLKPSKEEYLAQQHYLSSALHSENNTVVNFAISILNKIYKEDGFDVEGFMQNLDSLYVKEKMDKSIQKALKMVDYFMDSDKGLSIQYAESLAIGLSQVNTDTQALFGELLLKFVPKEELNSIVEPYQSVLKAKAIGILKVEKVATTALPEIEKREFAALNIPANWTDLVYHIGLCLKTGSAKDIELFLEGLNQLKSEIPADFEKQIKPYTKRLFNTNWDGFTIINLTEFFANWVAGNKEYSNVGNWKWGENGLPFLRHKCMLLHEKLQTKTGHIPFLSTPTHEPFYVHPEILIDKLLKYEDQKAELDLEDLLIATNRLLPIPITKSVLKKAKQLKGAYKKAIWYLLGISEEIEIDEKYLPLWTQVVRSKDPNKNFPIFEQYKVGKYPSVVAPFYPDFKILKNQLKFENTWNKANWYGERVVAEEQKLLTYTFPFYLAFRDNIYYQMTLMPHYIDVCLCNYTLNTTSSDYVTHTEFCQYPLQFLLENQIKVHHGGWIYIAQCLVFEKRISRDLAREYLLFAIANKTMNEDYFVDVVADMMIHKYAPVNRLIESFDEPDIPLELKQLYYNIAQKCIEKVNPKAKPRSFSKIVKSSNELAASLELSN